MPERTSIRTGGITFLALLLALLAGGAGEAADCDRAAFTVRTEGGRGTAFAELGDLNDDGVSELAVSAPGDGLAPGKIHVIDGATWTHLHEIEEDGSSGSFGWSLAPLTSRNGGPGGSPSRFLAVGSPCANNSRGRVFVLEVHSGGSSEALRLQGDAPGDLLGAALAPLRSAGGPRLLVGAPGSTSTGPGAGRVLVLRPDGTPTHESAGESANEGYGVAVADAGDVDGDGNVDYVVGSLDQRPGKGNGRATLRGPGGQLLLRLNGAGGEALGTTVAGLGDIDDDGFADFAAGAPGLARLPPCVAPVDPPSPVVGRVHVYRGGAVPVGQGGRRGTVLHSLSDDAPGSRFGSALAVLGDLTGDGRHELAVGAPGAGPDPRPEAGAVSVYSPSSGERIHRISGPRAGDELGGALLECSDQTADGHADLLAARVRRTGETVLFSLADADLDGTRDDCDACAAPLELVEGPGSALELRRTHRRKCLTLQIPRGKSYVIRLASEAKGATARLRLRWGQPPEDGGDADTEITGPLDAFPPLLGRDHPPGPGFLVLEGLRLAPAGARVQVTLEVSEGPILAGFAPARAAADPKLELTASILGVGLPRLTSFSLLPTNGGVPRAALGAVAISPGRVDLQLDLGGAAAGTYDLVALAAGQEIARLPRALTLTNEPRRERRRVTLSGPRLYRNGSLTRLTLKLENPGTHTLPPPLFLVEGPPGSRVGFSREQRDFAEQALGIGRSALTPDGGLPPGGRLEIPIWFRARVTDPECLAGTKECPLEVTVKLLETVPGHTIPWAEVSAPAGLSAADWNVARGQLAKEILTWADYRSHLAGEAAVLASRGFTGHDALRPFRLLLRRTLDLPAAAASGKVLQEGSGSPVAGVIVAATDGDQVLTYTQTNAEGYFVLDWLENGSTYTLEVVEDQKGKVLASTAPEIKLPAEGDLHDLSIETSGAGTARTLRLGCPPCEAAALPTEPVLPPAAVLSRWARTRVEVVSSFDPNEKQGSGTQGGDAEIDPTEAIEYRVYFENMGEVAVRNRLQITDELPPGLDWTTVELREVNLPSEPAEIALNLGGDDGAGVSGSSQTSSAGETLASEPTLVTGSSGNTQQASATWSGELAFHHGEERTVALDLTVRATLEAAGEATLGGEDLGSITWTFSPRYLDPPPLDGGFLAYGCGEDETALSCGGHVGFTVQPLESIADNSVIENDADIVFDSNPPIVTDPTAVVTVLRQAPQSPDFPFPANEASVVAPDGLRLSWESPYAESHEVYLWNGAQGDVRPASEDQALVWTSGEPSAVYPSGSEPLALASGQAWRWQVVAHGLRGEVVEGPVWRFTTGASFRRGDSDGNGQLSITDAIKTLEFLFLGGAAPGCLDALDTDDSGLLNITDAVFLLSYLFLGGVEVPAPGTESCGPDPTPDAGAELGCGLPGSC